VRGYLLDTNIVVYWFDARRPQHERVVRHIQALPEATPLMISAITLGEIEFGLQVSKVSTPEQEASQELSGSLSIPICPWCLTSRKRPESLTVRSEPAYLRSMRPMRHVVVACGLNS
jgi:predicted nucleic acid-binding protein